MKIVVVTDAWTPQVNGVVTTLSRVKESLEAMGHETLYITPQLFKTFPMPTYPEIRLAWRPGGSMARMLDEFRPDAIHIATEGTLGHAARRYCLKRGYPFTTAYHTQFPQYVRLRAPIPTAWTYAYLCRFHGRAARTMVPTITVKQELESQGFTNVMEWSRGVDTQVFQPYGKGFLDLPRPIAVCVGRVAVEKNLEAFLSLDMPGSKLVVGDGPDMAMLREKYPDAHFVGYKFGEELARHVAASDVFVFPSLTDTFGLTMLEAMACGVPVAAFPVTGPKDVVIQGHTGVLDQDLRAAVQGALKLNPEDCMAFARERTWKACAAQLLDYLAPIAREGMAAA